MLTAPQLFDFALLQHRAGRLAEATALYRQLLAHEPAHRDARLNLGIALAQAGDDDAACAAFTAVLEQHPGDFMANNNLGLLLRTHGRVDEAITCFRAALTQEPKRPEVHSNLIFTMLFHPALDREALDAELRAWNEQHATPLRFAEPPYTHDRTPDRRLRVGYVSPDFRDHVIGRNVLPLLREHDRGAVEVVCFSDAVERDSFTTRFRSLAAVWHDTANLDHDQLDSLIRREHIDILVDLTQHLARNRLPVFARRLAPIQASFAGYPGHTGVEAIDYRITDPHLDPHANSDTSAFIDSFWCFDPFDPTPPVGELSALKNGFVTFGCLNDPAKINDRVLQLWQRVLQAVPGSRLLIRAPLARQSAIRARLPGVDFTPRVPRAEYLALHHRIDIMLDTFPYPGHTTTCEALWMGVPVVSLAGETPISRGGLSILKNIGLPELVVHSEADYVHRATDLAGDLPRLAALRRSLRERMHSSPLMDAPRFAQKIEAAFREMWRRWCARA